MLIDHIIQNRNRIFDIPNEELRNGLLSANMERVMSMFKELSESTWLRKLSLTQVTTLAEKVIAIMPPDIPDPILDHFFEGIGQISPPTPNRAFAETLFRENPLFYQRALLSHYPLPLPQEGENKEVENLICLEMALASDVSGAAAAYIEQIHSLETTTPAGRDLLTILFYENNMHLIELALKRHLLLKGVEHVQKALSYHIHSIGECLSRGNPETISSFFELLDQFGIAVAPLVFNPDQAVDLLKICANGDALTQFLKILSPQHLAEALRVRAKDLVYNFLEQTPDLLETLLFLLKDFAIPILPLLLHKSDSGMSTIDAACVHQKKAHLEILLRHIDNDKVIIAFEMIEKQGMRRPLGCRAIIEIDNVSPAQSELLAHK